jgi:hypothetical protein
MYCIHCGKEISTESKFCRFCGTGIGKTSTSVDEVSEEKGQSPMKEKNLASAKFNDIGFIILTIVSFGLLITYNFIRISSLLKKEGYKTPAGIEFFIPIWGIVALYRHFDAFKKFQEDNDIENPISPVLHLLGYFIFTALIEILVGIILLPAFIWIYQSKVEQAFIKKYGEENITFGKIGVGGYLLMFFIPGIAILILITIVAINPIGRLEEADRRSGIFQYPNSIANEFVGACTAEGGSTAYCECTLDYFELRYTSSEYIELEQSYIDTGVLPDDFNKAVEKCTHLY